jgi:N-acetylneuraminic acid mutarotase
MKKPTCWTLGAAGALAAVASAAATNSSWAHGTPLPEPRTEVAAVAVSGEIVVAGGFTFDGLNSVRADAYDPARDSWRRLPDLPISLDHAAAAARRGSAYVIGGYLADRSPSTFVFRLESEGWRALPPLPEGRAAAAAAATADGRLYVVGGVAPDGLARRMLVLDLRTLRWSSAPGPTPRQHLAATAAAGRIYAIAGRTAGLDTNTRLVEVFDPRTRRWTRLTPVPVARGGTGAAVLGRRIVSVGGEAPTGTVPSVFAYDLRSRAWSRLPDLPTPRHGLGVVALRGRVWAVAGGPQPGLTVSGAVESLAIPP